MDDTAFDSIDFSVAEDGARREQRLLIVDFTATWCGPCQAMEKTTWRDATIIGWLRHHARAVQVDVDKQPDIAARFGVRAMPTVIALKDGQEVDRFVGARPTGAVLDWMEGLLRGESEMDRLRAAAKGDVMARAKLAQALLMAGKLEEATAEYLWLWEHVLEVEPAMVGVRHSFWLGELQGLVSGSARARAEFIRLRDRDAPAPGAWVASPSLGDWFALNQVLGEEEAGLAWFETIKAQINPERGKWLARWLSDPLKERKRWTDLAPLFPDPVATLNEHYQRSQEMLTQTFQLPEGLDAEQMVKSLKDYAAVSLRELAGELVLAMRAGGRMADATAVTARAAELDPSPEMKAALDAPSP